MPNAKLKHYLHLHFLVFIAGFTAIIGALTTEVTATNLVWYRMVIALILMLIYIKWRGISLKVNNKIKMQFFGAGIIIALHWVTFFESVKQANVSIALAMFSSGAFFASFIEPLIFKRRILVYEIVFGLIVAFAVSLITLNEIKYLYGIILGLLSALFSTLFAVINGKFIKHYKAELISFYEFLSGVIFLSIFIIITSNGFTSEFFNIKPSSWLYIFILASVCTAYAFIAAVEIMKYISPYTVILSYNLEPIYGVAMAMLLFPSTERMSAEFYIGAIIIIAVILLDAILKNRKTKANVKP